MFYNLYMKKRGSTTNRTTIQKIKSSLSRIAEKIAVEKCYKRYSDLDFNPKIGRIGRGLIFDDVERKNSKGVVIVGLNPGKTTKEERTFILAYPDYRDQIEFWLKKTNTHSYYYQPLRRLVDQLKIEGPILWTELVKCESVINGILSVPTIRDDINRFLFKEVEAIPKSWPLIGVGTKAFEILAYRFPDRLIIGVPHPSAFGNFWRLFDENKRLRSHIRRKSIKAISSNKPLALMLKNDSLLNVVKLAAWFSERLLIKDSRSECFGQ